MSQYDGTSKSLRPECETCPYHVAGQRAQRLLARIRLPSGSVPLNTPPHFCLWGVAIKVLEEPILRRRCDLPGQPAPGEQQLQDLIQGRGLWTSW